MASEAESVLGGGVSEGGDEHEYDPHANYRIDEYTYLVIEEDGGYDISFTPQEIPQDVVVEKDSIDICNKGCRHFRVRKYGKDTFDLVTVGTITVQNGFAYIAGRCVGDETPDESNESVYIPPFVISYPIDPPPRDPNEFAKEMEYKVHKHLRDQVAEHATVKSPCHLDINLTRRFSLQQQNRCKRCGDIMYRGGFVMCDFCYNDTLEDESGVSSKTNHEGCGGDKVETHKASMDTNVEDDHDHGRGKKRGRLE